MNRVQQGIRAFGGRASPPTRFVTATSRQRKLTFPQPAEPTLGSSPNAPRSGVNGAFGLARGAGLAPRLAPRQLTVKVNVAVEEMLELELSAPVTVSE